MTRVRTNVIWGREPQGAKLGAKPKANIDELFDRNARRDQLGSLPEHTLAFLEGTPAKAARAAIYPNLTTDGPSQDKIQLLQSRSRDGWSRFSDGDRSK